MREEYPMKKRKNTIKKRIFFSQISIVTASLLLTVIVFNIALRLYIRNQTKSQFITAGTLLHKTIATDLSTLNITGNTKKDDQQASKVLAKIGRTLKQTQFFLDINYAVIGRDKNLLYPNNTSEETTLLENELIPAFKKANSNKNITKANRIIYFSTAGKEYASLLYPLKSENNIDFGYLLLYSDLTQSNRLLFIVNTILLSILFIAAAAAFIISNITSKKISKPISELSKYAKQIGDRDYLMPSMEYDDAEIEQLAKTMEDMAQKLFAYDDTIKTFLQNASHELRTPLMSIQGYAEGIKFDVVDNKESAVNIIIDESKRLSSLVEDLLYLSKLDSLQDTVSFEPVNVENLVRSCIERVNGIALSSNKAIKLSVIDSNISISADEEKLSRAIINILGNCLRFAEQFIEVSLKKEKEKVVIEIKDDGPGFEEKDIDRIFERFYKGKCGKYGLGLAIAKTIVEKHNGNINAQNGETGGAMFRIVL